MLMMFGDLLSLLDVDASAETVYSSLEMRSEFSVRFPSDLSWLSRWVALP